MIEICNQLYILDNYNNKNIKTMSLCEDRWIIEALDYLRNNKNDKYYGFTLISDDTNIPGMEKSQSL